jgi:DNA-binding response OmpR family regulator
MLIFVEERGAVRDAFATAFTREGVALTGFTTAEFESWLSAAGRSDFAAIEGILLGDCEDRAGQARAIRAKSAPAVIALNEIGILEQTLDLFAAGIDDVVRKPVHVRELLARCRAIRRRHAPASMATACGPIRVFFDGRDPEVAGETLALPRRERRILEYLVTHQGKRVVKSQIFNAIYGLFDEDVEESVVESHVSKLRKKLRARIGYDPIESKRFLGYCLTAEPAAASFTIAMMPQGRVSARAFSADHASA